MAEPTKSNSTEPDALTELRFLLSAGCKVRFTPEVNNPYGVMIVTVLVTPPAIPDVLVRHPRMGFFTYFQMKNALGTFLHQARLTLDVLP